jgi:undecaprenyl-diphosphatase
MRLPAWLLLAWLAAFAGFVVMGAFASADDRFPGDLWLAEQVQEVDGDAFGKMLDYTAEFGDVPLMVAAAALAGAVAARFAGWTDGALVIGTLASRGVNSVVKEIIERPRPSPSLVHVESQPSSFSFPSGHAETVIVLFGFIFYLAAVHLKDARLRLGVQAACLWIILVTGVQRVYVGGHWPTDVLGGYYLGALMLAGLIALHRLVRARAGGLS